MWVAGNEWNYNGCYLQMDLNACGQRLNDVARLVKSYDPHHPVASVYGEAPPIDVIEKLDAIDVWGVNYYDELSFGDLFKRYAQRSTKPFFLGEYGADAYDARFASVNEDAQAYATRLLTQEIMENSAIFPGGICSGGLIFELADEWWKDGAGSPAAQDTGGIAPGGGPFPDRTFNEEWWGLVTLHREPRKAYFTYASLAIPKPQMAEAVLRKGGEVAGLRQSCTPQGCTLVPRPLQEFCPLQGCGHLFKKVKGTLELWALQVSFEGCISEPCAFEMQSLEVRASLDLAVRAAVEQGLLAPPKTIEDKPVALFYDLNLWEANLRALRDAFPEHWLHALALKTNPLAAMLRIARDLGFGAECASVGEAVHALNQSFANERVVFDSPCKTRPEIEFALRNQVHLNIDNMEELQRVSELLKSDEELLKSFQDSKGLIGVRINPLVGAGTIAAFSVSTGKSKFGRFRCVRMLVPTWWPSWWPANGSAASTCTRAQAAWASHSW
ncbi:unnamed protein product [Effrenium voratum]|nr:unnamed protein product [Effrenium voratum]